VFLLIFQRAPAAVGVLSTEAVPARLVHAALLHLHFGHLKTKQETSEVSGSHGGEAADCGVLGCGYGYTSMRLASSLSRRPVFRNFGKRLQDQHAVSQPRRPQPVKQTYNSFSKLRV
jgi:hypothetical protein